MPASSVKSQPASMAILHWPVYLKRQVVYSITKKLYTMRYILIAFTLLGTVFSFSIASGKALLPVFTLRGINMPLPGNPFHCTPVFGICLIEGGEDFPLADYSQPHDNAGFDANGNLVLEFVNYDFENDEWLNSDILV